MTFEANYFDGISAKHTLALVRVAGQSKHIAFDVNNETLQFYFADLIVQAKLGSAKRLIDLPNGGRLEAADISELEAAMPSKSSAFWRALHYLENHLAWVFASLIATVFAGWLFLQFGVPKLAEYVAKATPPSMENQIGKQALDSVDKLYFSPSKAVPARKASITVALNDLCKVIKNCPSYQLEFRDGGVVGANAFALPGGYMVVTDQLITLSKNDTEIVAVLAHELGHVKRRHTLRQSLQGVLSGLILAAITGDVSSVASGLPAALMQTKYSRSHETEADSFALNALQKACLPPRAFADILQRLQNQSDAEIGNKDVKNNQSAQKSQSKSPKTTNSVSEMLSTHPDTLERIKPFLSAKQNCS
jgi:Zn-dependent protease with chaperone function